jgi:hypothetical protein
VIIALDYDGCFTEDIMLWRIFASGCDAQGHRLIAVTMRYPSELMHDHLYEIIGEGNIFCTGRKAKKPFLEAVGIKPNVWIDDHPQSVFMDAEQIWGIATPEGHTNSTNAVDLKD